MLGRREHGRPFLRAAKKRSRGSEFVINFHGGPIGDLKKSFRQVCELAGLSGVTPHVLRHTAITWLMKARVSVWSVSGFVGASPETIHKVYGHHSPDYLSEAREALEDGGRVRRRNQRSGEITSL